MYTVLKFEKAQFTTDNRGKTMDPSMWPLRDAIAIATLEQIRRELLIDVIVYVALKKTNSDVMVFSVNAGSFHTTQTILISLKSI